MIFSFYFALAFTVNSIFRTSVFCFNLTILHTNDVHSRFLTVDSYGLPCYENKTEENCYGGFSRMQYKVNEIRASHPNVLYLSGGDYYQGTPWYKIYKWRLLSRFVNQFGLDAMTLGNHEFDDGIEGFIPFLDRADFPIISSNIDATMEPDLYKILKKSIVVEVDGNKIGIIGYTIKTAAKMGRVGMCKFKDEVTEVTKEAEKLHTSGVTIIIALGHSGYLIDLEVAKIPYIDVVVGAHTNTFLFTGHPYPSIEKPEGEYPTVVKSNGRNVLVVQAYEFGKYLGYLNVTFDSDGEVVNWTGNPVLLDNKIPKLETMEEELQEIVAKGPLHKLQKVIGKTNVFLEGLVNCRKKECSLGSLVADAMVEAINSQTSHTVSIAMIAGGNLRASVAAHKSITYEDVITIFPFDDTLNIINISGNNLMKVIQYSIKGYDPSGRKHLQKFLQVSGIKITFKVTENQTKVAEVLVAVIGENGFVTYEVLNPDTIYEVVITNYLANGGDGYKMISKYLVYNFKTDIPMSTAIVEYIKLKTPILKVDEGRIRILNLNTLTP